MKAIVLFSGGLDSLLVSKILQEQGFTVIGLNMVTPFFNGTAFAKARAEELGIELRTHVFGQEYMDMLKKPRWGVGKAVNPCIDCRIMMCRAAAELMKEIGAEFVATGEIAGQRPNSQMVHQLNLIARESGLEGKLVRPLSGRVLPSTVPEQEGILAREALHSYTGRFRTGLIAMAQNRYKLPVIPQPSTGCLLCEKSFAPRIRDLLKHCERPHVWDAHMLAVGRHLRVDEKVKCVIGRKEADNDQLFELIGQTDRTPCFLLSPNNFNGPALVMIGAPFDPSRFSEQTKNATSENDLDNEIKNYLDLAAALILHYSKPEKYGALREGPQADFQLPGAPSLMIDLLPNEEKAASLTVIQEQFSHKSAPKEKEENINVGHENTDNESPDSLNADNKNFDAAKSPNENCPNNVTSETNDPNEKNPVEISTDPINNVLPENNAPAAPVPDEESNGRPFCP